MSDKAKQAFPSGDLSPASKEYTFYPDAPASLFQTPFSIVFDGFLVVAVGITIVVGYKRLAAFMKRLIKTRRRPAGPVPDDSPPAPETMTRPGANPNAAAESTRS